MLSPSQSVPAKWPRHSTERNPLSIKAWRTQRPLALPLVQHSDSITATCFPGEPLLLRIQQAPPPTGVTLSLRLLCTCQEAPDDREGVKDPDVSLRRAAASTKEVPLQRRGVRSPRCSWFSCCWRGATPSMFTPMQNTAPGIHTSATVTLPSHACSQRGGVSPQPLALALSAMKMCSLENHRITKVKNVSLPPSAMSPNVSQGLVRIAESSLTEHLLKR